MAVIKKTAKALRAFARRRSSDRALFHRIRKSDNARFLRSAAPGSYYSPIPDMATVRTRDASASVGKGGIAGIRLREAEQLKVLGEVAHYYPELHFPHTPRSGYRFHFDNTFFSYGDAIVLYGLMRILTPSRIIEIGSGFSSAAMLDIDEQYLNKQIDFVFIDPFPRRLRGLLSETDTDRVRVVQARVEDLPLEMFDELESGDILFIDSSHVAKIDSDVLHILFRVLPRLAPGVVVHFHDIFWPFEYPRSWTEAGRAWNEAYLLRAFLQFNDDYEILLFNSFLEHLHHDQLAAVMPLAVKSPSKPLTLGNSSLWLRRTDSGRGTG